MGAMVLTQLVVFGAFMRLFDGTNAGSVPGFVPWVLLLGYLAALGLVAAAGFHYHGARALPLAFGLAVVLAASIPFGGGCEVASGGSGLLSLLPQVDFRGLSLVLRSGTGCTYPVVAPLMGAGYALLGWGLWVVSAESEPSR